MRWLRTALITAAGLALVMSVLVPTARAADNDDPADQHALGAYDQFACNGAEEDELDTGDPNEDYFPAFSVSFQSSDNGDDFATLSGGYLFPFTDKQVKQKYNRDSNAATQPTAMVEVTPGEPRPGDEVAIIAALADFADDGSSASRMPAITFALNDVSLQGIVAGGKSLPEGGGSACGTVTRTPQTDADGDGMDDTWESVHGLNPNDPGDAFDDPDNDSSARFISNALGEELIISPSTGGGGPGVMNNKAEFDLDLDPQRADTDKDGTSDGDEVLGFGGQTVSFTNELPAGEQFTVRVYAAGTSLMVNADAEFAPIVKLDSATRTVASSNGERLRGEAVTAEPFTEPGETARIEAHFVGTQGEPSAFEYTYIVDGEEVVNPLPSRNVLEVPIEEDRQPGTFVPYELRAVNKSSGQLAVLRGAVRVGESIALEATPPSPAAGEPVTIHAVLASGTSPTSYLYEWRVDGELDEQASGIGRDSLVLTAPPGSSSQVVVGLQLYAVADGQFTGQAETTISVARPSVTIELVPAEPVAGNAVTGVAAPTGFARNLDTDGDSVPDATQLEYVWVVDGTTLPPDVNAAGISTVKLSAGTDGTAHSMSVQVRSVGGQAESARATAGFTTLPGGTSLRAPGSSSGSLVAAAVSALPPSIRWIGAGVAVVGIGLAATVVVRRRTA